jgi:hypothetical protein
VRLVQDAAVSIQTRRRADVEFVMDADILVVDTGVPGIYQTYRSSQFGLGEHWEPSIMRSLEEECIDAVAAAWEDSEGYIVRQVDEQRMIMRNYENRNRDQSDTDDDTGHPYREKIGYFRDGVTVHANVRTLNMHDRMSP